jgi:hypothetical protein
MVRGSGQDGYAAFFPNAGSTLIRAVATIDGNVATQTQTKNQRYPSISWIQPLAIPGIIIPRAMKPVQRA